MLHINRCNEALQTLAGWHLNEPQQSELQCMQASILQSKNQILSPHQSQALPHHYHQ